MWQNKFMKGIVAIILLSLASTAFALPNCPSDPNQRYDNCFGSFFFSDGDEYVGEFKDDMKHGQGAYIYANGEKYVGGFKDSMKNGQGTYTFATGDKYVGEWKDEKYHGQGTYTFVDGRKETGYYMDGNFLPDICEGMGLSKGTSEFGKCVLKLIDKL